MERSINKSSTFGSTGGVKVGWEIVGIVTDPSPKCRIRTRFEEWHGVGLVSGHIQFDGDGTIVRDDDVGNNARLAGVAIASDQHLGEVTRDLEE